jgi:hypothetical protein
MTMSPGTYVQLRREAAELSIDDVAMMLPTEPHVDVLARAAWLRTIEADAAPIGIDVISALRYAFAFDAFVLSELDYLRKYPGTIPEPMVCERCDDGCWWKRPGLCSSCPDDPADDSAEEVPHPVNDRAAA